MSSSKHDAVATRIANKRRAEYNKGQGPDIVTADAAIEVETAATVKDGLRQLQGFRKPVYIAAADQKALDAALQATDGKTVGVMDEHGKIVRRSTRKRR